MAKGILLWGAPTSVADNQPLLSAFEQSGKNFGNILIGYAVKSFLAGKVIFSRSDVGSPQEANELCDQVVIPAANFLWKDFDFGYMADFLEETHLPIVIMGVGAQTNDRTTISQIHPNTLRLMRLISERSVSLGVRGFYTAEVLAANGIHNVKVIGCPSLYVSRKPSLAIDRSRLMSHTISVNFSRRVYKHSFNPERLRKIENALLKLALNREAAFIAQDEIEELNLTTNGNCDTTPITSYFSELDKSSVINFFKRNTQHYLSFESWSAAIRGRAVSIGSRFHGNLIALVNGVPAVTIVHDSRTMEMCALMGNPILHVNEIRDETLTEEALWDLILHCSFERFENNYRQLYKRFTDFFQENGLKHNLPLS